MTGWRKRQVQDMAKEAGLRDWTCNGKYGCLEAFEALVRADEREACAKVCEHFADVDSGPDGIMQDYHAHLIRARGEQA
jgi:hypothetical protein